MALEPVTKADLYDPERKWIFRASCRTVDPERFFGPPGPQLGRTPAPDIQKHWNAAKKLCGHCPVQMACRRDSLGEEYGVWGGMDERERWLIRKKLSKLAHRWSVEKRLAWGKELHALRSRDVGWTRIRHMTGISDVLGNNLIKEHLAHKLAEGAARRAQVVDLPLPERDEPPWPAALGRRNAWVWARGLMCDSWYRAETEDGRFFFMQVGTKGGESQIWVPREHVRLHHPQPVQILDYVGRPDREQSQKAG